MPIKRRSRSAHFPVDRSIARDACARRRFQRARFDLVKVTDLFCIRDWGAEYECAQIPKPRSYKTRYLQPQDWERLPVLDSPLRILRTISLPPPNPHETRPNTPMLQTIFNPLAQRKILPVKIHFWFICENIRSCNEGLQTIAISTRRFVEAALETGMDGIFMRSARQAALLNETFKHFSKALICKF